MTTPRRPSRRPSRSTRATKRRLTPEQWRELRGVALVGIGLLALVAMIPGGGPILAGLRATVTGTFGYGWPPAVAATIAVGALMVWPKAPSLPRPQLAAACVGFLALLGLLSLASAPAGGAIGRSVLALLAPAGALGNLLLLLLVLAVTTLVALPGGPGAGLQVAGRGARAAYLQRERVAWLWRLLAGHVGRLRGRRARGGPGERPETSPGPTPAARRLAATDTDQVASGAPSPRSDEDAATEGGGEAAEDAGGNPGETWSTPALSLLDPVVSQRERAQAEIERTKKTIVATLATFGVEAKVIDVSEGPSVIQYALQPAAGVPVRKVVACQNDLALALAATSLRIEAPIPGRAAIGIEVPKQAARLVTIREVAESPAFRPPGHLLSVVLGCDVAGRPVAADLTRMPHLLIAGATGQGKSVCINCLVCSLLLQLDPDRLWLLMIDPKRVELQGYDGLPHLAVPVIVEPHLAAAALRWAVGEMGRRYKVLAAAGARNIAAYNARAAATGEGPLPYVVIVIDELADLMMVAAGEVEELICRIAQLARAVGIHLVIATQRPSREVITGLIKANIPSRIAFAVGSQIDSRVILDSVGAEKLVGSGDMLYRPVDASRPARLQGAFIADREVEDLVGFWRAQGEPHHLEGVLDAAPLAPATEGGEDRQLDPLFARAARAVAAEGAASVSLVQRKFNVGYSRAGRLVDQLAAHGVIGPYQGSKSREVLMGLPDVDELLERIGLEG